MAKSGRGTTTPNNGDRTMSQWPNSNIHNKLYNEYFDHIKRREEIMELKDDGLGDCTFQPNINSVIL